MHAIDIDEDTQVWIKLSDLVPDDIIYGYAHAGWDDVHMRVPVEIIRVGLMGNLVQYTFQPLDSIYQVHSTVTLESSIWVLVDL